MLLSVDLPEGQQVNLNNLGGRHVPAVAIPEPPAATVLSVFGRVGAVVAAVNDYAASQVGNDSSVPGATVKDALDALLAAIPPAAPVALFAGILTDVDTLKYIPAVGWGPTPTPFSSPDVNFPIPTTTTLTKLTWNSGAADNTTQLDLYANGAYQSTHFLTGTSGQIAISQVIAATDRFSVLFVAGKGPDVISLNLR